MGNITYMMMASLDGFVEDREGSIEWVLIDEELHRFVNDWTRASSALLFGRKMYQLMMEFWPTADEDPANPDFVREYSTIWKSKPKYVFSKTTGQVEGDGHVITGNLTEEVGRLKTQYVGDLMLGGPGIAAEFMRLGLVDEYQVYMNPIILGGGKPMYPQLEQPVHLRLAETHAFKSGVTFLRYTATLE